MDEKGVFWARLLGGILPSIYRECGMSLNELTIIHAAHNSLYRAYEFGLPDVVEKLESDLVNYKTLQLNYSALIQKNIHLNYKELRPTSRWDIADVSRLLSALFPNHT